MSVEPPSIMAFQELLMAFREVTRDFRVPTADDKGKKNRGSKKSY